VAEKGAESAFAGGVARARDEEARNNLGCHG